MAFISLLVVVSLFVISTAKTEQQNCSGNQCQKKSKTYDQFSALQFGNNCAPTCKCGGQAVCPPGVGLIRDGCGCCWQCARQAGEACDEQTLCDASKDLACLYRAIDDRSGICKVMKKLKCSVKNASFEDGDKFLLDCRTQCTCKNGTYACVSLCPSENIHPSLFCKTPHLISVPGQCCREWRCKGTEDTMDRSPCKPSAGKWSECSAKVCGLGLSYRWFVDSFSCEMRNESRLCQVRPCNRLERHQNMDLYLPYRHHIRRGHKCRATQRPSQSFRLQVGDCISEGRYRPKFCDFCHGFNCSVFSATTISIQFICPLHAVSKLLRMTFPHQEITRNTTETHKIDGPLLSINDVMDEDHLLFEDMRNRAERERQVVDLGVETTINPIVLNEQRFFKGVYAQTLFTDNDKYFNEINQENHEVVTHKVQWIMRCHCSVKF